MQKILAHIDQLNNQLISLSPLKAEYQQKLDKKFRLEFSYNSNHLEGNTLTYGETELLLIFGETKGSHDKREYDEMEAHDVAFERIKEWAAEKERPLTTTAIKNLNELILVKPFWKDAITPDGQSARRLIKIGDYKEYPNSVRLPNGQMFDYASPAETPIQMGELIDWYRSEEEKKELHPVALAALLHYRFVRIHPFDDGNGRISRLLVNYVLLKNNLPPVIIKSAQKSEYLHALHQADAGYLDEFIDYIAEQVRWSLEISIKAAKGESIDEPGDMEKKIKALKHQLKIDDDVQVEKSNEVVIACYQNSLLPLFETISSKLSMFDSLFKTKKEDIPFYKDDKTFGQASNIKNISSFFRQTPFPDSFRCFFSYENLRASRKNITIGVNFEVKFLQLVYEITSIDSNINIDKLYHEILTNEECVAIAEALGNDLLEKIEAALT